MTYEEKIIKVAELTKVQNFFYYAKIALVGAVFTVILIMLKF